MPSDRQGQAGNGLSFHFEKEKTVSSSLRPSPRSAIIPLLLFLTILVFGPSMLPAQEAQENQKAKEKREKPAKITEEILVIGRSPKDVPLATVSTVVSTDIDKLKPRDISDVLKFIPGSIVTFGDKDTYTLKLRGIGANRIALLVDGVPVYEPYFSTFDLKTVSSGGIDTIQVTKGPSSVLYGPNTLGGLVNVITKRPTAEPSLSLTGSYGDKDTKGLGLDGSCAWKRFALSAGALYQGSDGFFYPEPDGGQLIRNNSDFKRLNLNAKLYYTPSSSTEIMVNGGLYQSEYGMPPALFTQRARFWRFPKWDRSTLNLGGFTSLGGDAVLRFRAFTVNYINTLDWFNDPAMTDLDSSSTYDNTSYGGFALAEVPAGDMNTVKASLLYQKDIARIQDDTGLPWDRFDQGTVSAGVEDHFSLTDQWKIIGGLSLDYIDKFAGGREQHLAQSPDRGQVHPERGPRLPCLVRPQIPFSLDALALFTELGQSRPPRRVRDGVRARRDLERPRLRDRVRVLQPVQEFHRFHHSARRDETVPQRRPGPHQRLRGPGPEGHPFSGGDRELHLPRSP